MTLQEHEQPIVANQSLLSMFLCFTLSCSANVNAIARTSFRVGAKPWLCSLLMCSLSFSSACSPSHEEGPTHFFKICFFCRCRRRVGGGTLKFLAPSLTPMVPARIASIAEDICCNVHTSLLLVSVCLYTVGMSENITAMWFACPDHHGGDDPLWNQLQKREQATNSRQT